MSEASDRLVRCFSAVFPKLSPAEIRVASGSSVAEWDSVANITLLSLIEEEFGVLVDFEDFDGTPSFAILLDSVEEKLGDV